jgi:hypothetical protein
MVFSSGVIDSLLPACDWDGGIWMSVTRIAMEIPVNRI